MTARLSLAAAIMMISGATAHACDGLTARDGWMAPPPPGAPSHAGYLTLVNHGAAPQTLTGLTAPGYAGAMLHESVMEDGVMKMRHLMALEIPPGDEVVLAPHGLHLMLMGPNGPVAEGDSVSVDLSCAVGARLSVELAVRGAEFGAAAEAHSDRAHENHAHENHALENHAQDDHSHAHSGH